MTGIMKISYLLQLWEIRYQRGTIHSNYLGTLLQEYGWKKIGTYLVFSKLKLKFSTHKSGDNPVETFSWHVNNTNDGPSSEKVGQPLKLQVQIGTKVDISVENKRMIYREDSISRDFSMVEHLYSIENRGPVDIWKGKVVIQWPDRTLHGREILKLEEIKPNTVPFDTKEGIIK